MILLRGELPGIMPETHDIRIKHADLDTYLIINWGFEGTLIKILVEETRRRFGSIEEFLRKCEYGKYIDKLKKQLGK